MKQLSLSKLAEIIIVNRKKKSLTQQQLSDVTNINRATISRIEAKDFIPSISQLESLSQALNFDITDLFIEPLNTAKKAETLSNVKIAVAGTGYVGLSIATLLAQNHQVTAVDIVQEKVDLINNRKSPIQDEYIEKFLAEKDLNLSATLDGKKAYKDADFVVIAAPTNYDSKRNYFDTSAV